MGTKGLLVRLEVKAGNDDAMAEAVLRSALATGRAEAATTAWFAIRFGRSEYGIFDVFPDDAGREAHLAGPVTQALLDAGGSVFARAEQSGGWSRYAASFQCACGSALIPGNHRPNVLRKSSFRTCARA
ncbi:hypothetical protein SAMN05192544_104252 [Paraburkholderia hospita]|nr:hypothetical protein SAMN05192544_104252 [Paraburkholderia hospita]